MTAIEVASTAAERFVALANDSINRKGSFKVALAGGSTPKKMYELLRETTLDWSKVEFFWSDERFVPPTDPQSNEGMAREMLLDHIRGYRAHGIVVSDDVAKDADAYAALLPETLDLILLGLGPDGHTASLFPGYPGVHETTRTVIPAQAPVNAPWRITMTPTYINRFPIWFLVTGADKKEPLDRLLNGPENWDETPSQAIARHADHVEIFVDAAALG